jgi:hypothetical protein
MKVMLTVLFDIEGVVHHEFGKNSPRLKKAQRVRSIMKVMLTVFFDIEGVVHHEFLRRANSESGYYLKVLKFLRENVRRKRPQLWKNDSWFLHHEMCQLMHRY